ncbi:hypothetical protein V202x_31500 [Gimesia aquarii]|uniref:Uncharacterized protein n=1 Tax=Gimesia aquarii TaxID=2527964 RepID=A0A517WX00_9PLAN|nr:hypothetical protein V202x_31500 [Gimesia aquarii]
MCFLNSLRPLFLSSDLIFCELPTIQINQDKGAEIWISPAIAKIEVPLQV